MIVTRNNIKKFVFILKIIVSIGLLYYLFNLIEIETFLTQFHDLEPIYIILAFSILLFQVLLTALKWKIILSADKMFMPIRYLMKSCLIGNFISLFLPTSFGGDFYRIYALKRYSSKIFKNASSVIFDRLTGLFGLTTIAIVSSTIFFHEFINYYLIIIYLFSVIIFWIVSSEKLLKFFNQYQNRIFTHLLQILDSFNQYRNNYILLFYCLTIALFFHSNIVIINKFYCLALNIDFKITYLYMIIPLIYLTEALPVSINGLGVRESAYVFFFIKFGHTKEEALALAILVVAMRYFVAVSLGGVLFFKEFLSSKRQ